MLKLGALTFGGGYAMVPLFEAEFVRKRGWIDSEEMANMVALSLSVARCHCDQLRHIDRI